MTHGSRRTPDSLLEATASSFAILLGVALLASSTAPAAVTAIGAVLFIAGAVGLAIVLTRR